MLGTVFDIQRFSVHDGPGIRTTVFMKGCPLRCRWCHNPEGLSGAVQLQYFQDKCIGCDRCGSRSKLTDSDKCPTQALKVCGYEITEDELLKIILRDKPFYSDNGGVTFSGGECLMQADYVTEMLRLSKENGLNTAVDTCGAVSFDKILKVSPYCDVFLYDIKCINKDKHIEFTGVDNALILENAKKLSDIGKEIWIRIPFIPTFNDSEDEMNKIADFICGLRSIKNVTVMPYHSLGASKYETLGLSCNFDTSLKITDDKLSAFKEILKGKNLTLN